MTGEPESLVAEHPLRERLWRLLVLALYRGERQADALAAYRRARAIATRCGFGATSLPRWRDAGWCRTAAALAGRTGGR